MSFTTGGLYLRESVELASQYLGLCDWATARDFARHQNLFMSRTASSADRMIGESVLRLKTLEKTEIELLVEGTHSEQQQLLWVAVCRVCVEGG